jgi:hypothetical protein
MHIAQQNRRRAARSSMALRRYDSDGSPYTGLIDFLADAMHWCRLKGHDFHDLLDRASEHYAAEILDETSPVDQQPP